MLQGVGRDWKQVLHRSAMEDLGGGEGDYYLGDHGVSRCQDKSLAYSFLPYLPIPNSNPRADVDNPNIFTNTWFMLSAPCIITPFVSAFHNYTERTTRTIEEITHFFPLLFQNLVWNSRLYTRGRQSVSIFHFVFFLISRDLFIPAVSLTKLVSFLKKAMHSTQRTIDSS